MIVYISSDKISLKRISQSKLPLTWPLAPSYIFLVVISQGFIFQRVHLLAKQFRTMGPLVVFGISTISRGSSKNHSYLRHNLTSLRNHFNPKQTKEEGWNQDAACSVEQSYNFEIFLYLSFCMFKTTL